MAFTITINTLNSCTSIPKEKNTALANTPINNNPTTIIAKHIVYVIFFPWFI